MLGWAHRYEHRNLKTFLPSKVGRPGFILTYLLDSFPVNSIENRMSEENKTTGHAFQQYIWAETFLENQTHYHCRLINHPNAVRTGWRWRNRMKVVANVFRDEEGLPRRRFRQPWPHRDWGLVGKRAKGHIEKSRALLTLLGGMVQSVLARLLRSRNWRASVGLQGSMGFSSFGVVNTTGYVRIHWWIL